MSYKIVYIKRMPLFGEQANREAQEFFDNASKSIGSFFTKGGRKPESGLTFAEERLLMPLILGIESTDKDFRKTVETYFHEITTKVPPKEGKRLNISLEDDEQPLSDSNLPIEPEDYVKYRHALKNPQVALSEKSGRGNSTVKYYIDDNNANLADKLEETKLVDKALGIYLLAKDDVKKVRKLLVNLGEFTVKLKEEERIIKLKEIAEKKPKFFIETAENKDLDVEYEINLMIQAKILERLKNTTRIIIKESGTEIGAAMKEAVYWWRDATNSAEVNAMKARYKEFAKNSD